MDGSYPHPGGPTGTRKVYPDKAIGNCGLKTVFPKLLEARKQASKRRGREGYGGGGMSIASTRSVVAVLAKRLRGGVAAEAARVA